MATFGRVQLGTTGFDIEVAADGDPEWKAGGITMDWTTVPTVAADTTLNDGLVVRAGQSGLEYGQILSMITASGKYGPYNPAATDGRQLLQRGACGILNRSMLSAPFFPIVTAPTDHPAVITGGMIFRDRLKVGGLGNLANPAFAAQANPTTAPTFAAASGTGGPLAAGVYGVYYTYVTATGETGASPVGNATITAGQQINVQTVVLPAGVTSANWYVQAPGTANPTFFVNNNGAAFAINAYPAANAAVMPTTSRVPFMPALADFEAAFPRIRYARS